MKEYCRMSVLLPRWLRDVQTRSHGFSLTIRFVLILVTSVGCQSRLTEDEYVRWVTDYENELHVKESISGLIFDIQYQPEQLIRIQRDGGASSHADRVLAQGPVEPFQYYVLTIGTEDGVDIIHYNARNVRQKQERQYYLSYRFQDDITLEENGTILPCLLYHAQGPTGRGGARTFLLGFEKPSNPSSDVRMVIRSEAFSSLPIKIRVAKTDIPTIDL